MKFSKSELIDLFKSLGAIGLAFAIASAGIRNFLSLDFLLVLAISLISAGAGFFLHELSHKYFAQRIGCWAEYKSNDKMLILTLLFSFMGVVFAAPGAVFIRGYMSKRQHGVISASGPATNIILALFFIALSFAPFSILQATGDIGSRINAWLAVFNLIPFPPFDGRTVFSWNKWVWGGLVAAAIGIMVFSYAVL